MIISQKGVALVKEFEQLYLEAYQCAAKVWTIGWGTTIYPNSSPVKEGDKCSREQAELYLANDMAQFSKKITSLTDTIKLSQLQFDAFVSMAYNIGASGLERSTLVAMLRENPSNPAIIGDESMSYLRFGRGGQFLNWTLVKGVRNKGLIRRRKAEAWLFATGVLRFFEEMNADFITPLENYITIPRKI